MGEPHGGEVDLVNFASPPWWGGRILADFGLPPHGAKPGGAFFENTAPPPMGGKCKPWLNQVTEATEGDDDDVEDSATSIKT